MTRSSQGVSRADPSGSYNPMEDLALLGPSRSRVVLIGLVSLISSGLVTVLLDHFVAAVPQRPIPALVGFSVDHARGVLAKRGLGLSISGTRPDPLVPTGSIAAQDPLARQSLGEGGTVIVVLSTGKPQLHDAVAGTRGGSGGLPSSVSPPPSLDRRAAVKATSPASAAPETARWDRSPSKAPRQRFGSAVASAPGTPGPSPRVGGAPAAGARSVLVAVPYVLKMRLHHARAKLKRVGLRLGRVRYRTDEDHMAGMVLEQRPVAGKRLPSGGAVDVFVNRYQDDD